MREISEREMTIFALRRYDEKTFKELAEITGLSKSRVAAIHKRASRIAYNILKKTHTINFTCDQLEGLKYYYDYENKNSYRIIRKNLKPYPKNQALQWFCVALREEIKNKLTDIVKIIDYRTSGIEDLEQLVEERRK